MKMEMFWKFRVVLLMLIIQTVTPGVSAQQVYFIDGYHGGIYGHYPKQYTAYINETLEKHPGWKINLEIEPETWDSVLANEPSNYKLFKAKLADQKGRIEYVNPAYGQPYLYNINGESIIRQFSYGIKKLHQHFPFLEFSTYSSEEPCFTSALPQLLKSFGFKYASLKNPNTCWGGYTRAYGGQMLNWVGPDGTKLLTVPRYEVEALDPNSTWQTTASTNSKEYLQASFNAGIKAPVGMCLQDAGWRNGPWLGNKTTYPTEYLTWRNYFESFNNGAVDNWKFSQEDVQVSLVWGAQVLQKIAQQVRASENNITSAEVLSTMANVYAGQSWPANEFDEAWRTLLLAQHHDCWIVPYNGRKGNTWIDKVEQWTATTNKVAEDAINVSMQSLAPLNSNGTTSYARVFNSTARERKEWVMLPFKKQIKGTVLVVDSNNKPVPSRISGRGNDKQSIIFLATVPPVGYNTYVIRESVKPIPGKVNTRESSKETVKVETDHYIMELDPSKGGIIKSFVAKKLGNKQFVDQDNERGFNELRGYFFKDSSYSSSMHEPATVNVIENGSDVITIEIKGKIHGNPFLQKIELMNGQPLVNMDVKIDWLKNEGIGDDYKQFGGYKAEDYRKAFYDDSKKLQTLFPLALNEQALYKDAPFDVTESRLDNSFFSSWDSIKNNIILNWVDITDGEGKYGLALFSDHTTSYAHGRDHPLGLTTQYSGVGLWGRNYSITGPTEIRYALLPHEGTWKEAGIWNKNVEWNKPMVVKSFNSAKKPSNATRSLLRFSEGLELTSLQVENKDMIARVFNSTGKPLKNYFTADGMADKILIEELNGDLVDEASVKHNNGKISAEINIPAFGVRTIRFKNFRAVK